MIEPLTATAIAVGTVITQKTLEKTEDKVSDLLSEKISQFITNLTKIAPKTATALELAPEHPLDYGQAVLEVETVAKNDEELAKSINELAKAVEAEPNLKLQEILKEIKDTLASQQPTIQNIGKLAEKIAVVAQGGTTNINTINL
ncbi:conserved hypothetical protein [Gloeothece citriformis PCC 7424]|uniref:Uncharacterized protein n=1 Tax=Gloeothece citriformis (strain PCC 7424) TaxID=65393 RepID=B7KC93_GLOC7|nr:hypothetical protein [Gloeothece citriformis]ACK70198.1 conserved hypothetical protein [Gloeothece citriformis PCC 7424]